MVTISACRGPGAPPDKASYTVLENAPRLCFFVFECWTYSLTIKAAKLLLWICTLASVVSIHTAQLSAVTDLRPPLSGIGVSCARARRGVFAVLFLLA